MLGESLAVDRRAVEQQLDVEVRFAAPLRAGLVPSFFSSPITPSASAQRRLCASIPAGLLQRDRAASAWRWASVAGSSPAFGSIVGCGGVEAGVPRRSGARPTRPAAEAPPAAIG